MNLNIISDWPLVDSYLDVLRGARDSLDAPFKYFTLIEDEDHFEDGPVLVLGRPEIEPPKGRRVGHAPSVRETLNTPGGGTKLTQVLGWLSRKEGQVPITWYFANDGDAPVWNGELTAVDIEVSGDITVDEPEDTELLSVALAHWVTDEDGIDRIEAVVYSKELLDNAEWCADLHDALHTNTLLTHNGKFDFRWINALLDTTLYPDEDTILMSHALYPGAQDHGLKSVAKRLFGAPDWDAGLKEYLKGRRGHYERVPNDILCEYNVLDVYWTLLIYDYLKERIVDTPQEWLYRSHTLPASHMMQDIEAWGMEIDQKYLKKLERLFTAERDRLLATLHTLAGGEFNPASPKQLKEVLHATFGWRTSNTKSETLRAKVMGTKDGKLSQFVATLLAYRKVSKSLSTYVLGIQKRIRRGRVHTTFLLHGPTTGRTSSRGPNLQNVTNDGDDHLSLRRMFVPNRAKNYKLIGADYAQAELRTMAELSNDALMIKHLQRDAPDFFDNMMPHVFPEIDFTKMDKAHRKPYRLKLKRVVYGCVPYGTRILTRRGWLAHDEVVPNEDETIGYNLMTESAEWTKITAVNYYGQQPVGRLGNARWGFDVTPGHRWIVNGRNHPTHMRTTLDLNTETNIVVASELSNHAVVQPKFTLDEMRVLSWILSDGYLVIRPYTGRTAQGRNGERRKVIASIQQAKPVYVEEIQELLAKLSLDTNVDSVRPGVNYDVAHDWHLPPVKIRDILQRAGLMDRTEPGDDLDIDTELVPWLLSLPREYIDVYLETFCKAEGHKRPDGSWVITQNPGGKLDACEVAAVINGYRVSRTKHGSKCLRLNLLSKQHVTNQVNTYDPDHLEPVWCPTTALGTWTAQQSDGRIALTGNSSYGLTSHSISNMLTLEGQPTSQDEAARIQDGYLGLYKGLSAWRESVLPRVLDGHDLLTPFGRRFQQDVVTDSNVNSIQNQAWSFMPQGVASDIAVRAAMAIHNIFKSHPDRDIHLCALVHDAIYAEAPEEWAKWASLVIAEQMEAAAFTVFKRVPFLVDTHIGDSWDEC